MNLLSPPTRIYRANAQLSAYIQCLKRLASKKCASVFLRNKSVKTLPLFSERLFLHKRVAVGDARVHELSGKVGYPYIATEMASLTGREAKKQDSSTPLSCVCRPCRSAFGPTHLYICIQNTSCEAFNYKSSHRRRRHEQAAMIPPNTHQSSLKFNGYSPIEFVANQDIEWMLIISRDSVQ